MFLIYMAQPQNFLDDFQSKMDRLTNIRQQLQASVQFKEQFTNDLKTKLGDINDRIKSLVELINSLKTKADNLESQIGTNTTSINDKEKELQQLKDQINSLTSERDNLNAKANQQEEQAKNQMAELQNTIDKYEAELRDVKQKYEAQTAELNALREQMTKTGNEKDAAYAENLKQLTEQSEKQLQEQEAQLTQKINDCEGKLGELNKQIQDKDNELQQKQKTIDEATTQAQNSSQNLQQQIDAVKAENQQLIQRLKDATEAINEANDELENIVNSVPNADTKQEIDTLLNQITQQLEQSIQNISRAAQGQPTVPSASQGYKMALGANIVLMDIASQSNKTIPFSKLIKMLSTKASQIKEGENKYKDALQQLREANDVSQVQQILTNKGIDFKNDQIMGGRKTRKNKKQKGGFTYRKGSVRKSITLRRNLRTTSNKSSRRSSRRSSR
jgi:chromosome segregation ATPase